MEPKCHISRHWLKPKSENPLLKELPAEVTYRSKVINGQQQFQLLGTFWWLFELQYWYPRPSLCICAFVEARGQPQVLFPRAYFTSCFVFEQHLLEYTDQHPNSTSVCPETLGIPLPLPPQLLELQAYTIQWSFPCGLIKFRSSCLQGKQFAF